MPPISHTQITSSTSLPKKPDLADVFRRYSDDFLKTHKLPPKKLSVIHDIQHCRDGKFGFHVDVCDNCGHKETFNNSCRNRHCPKCSSMASKKWVNQRLNDLLPVPYYHMVFTLPHELNPLCRFNQKQIYELLFLCASKTLHTFAQDPKWLGAKIGFYGILHTWGGKLWQHIHLHFVVTGGGLNERGKWVHLKHNGRFIFPVTALSKRFRKLLMSGLKRLHKTGKFIFPDTLKGLYRFEAFDQWLYHTFPKKIVVYAKPPFKGAEEVVRYISRYSHRVAISNQRIKDISDNKVQFSYKNTKKNRQWEDATLTATEFIKRFTLHVLPNGFHRIRHYGILANGKCKESVKYIRALHHSETPVSQTFHEDVSGIFCPECKTGRLIVSFIITSFGIFTLNNALWNTS